uniref:Ovule protein n=1 Tax=Ascaris lumbricoides TaxID=6252 RepID=A0A0M3ING5_ASCLU
MTLFFSVFLLLLFLGVYFLRKDIILALSIMDVYARCICKCVYEAHCSGYPICLVIAIYVLQFSYFDVFEYSIIYVDVAFYFL